MGPALRLAACALLLASCNDSGPVPILRRVEPALAFNDADLRLTILGSNFLPSFEVDPVEGKQLQNTSAFTGTLGAGDDARTLTDFAWLSTGELVATLPAGIPAGVHDVTIVDPRGRRALLDGGFTSLGPDTVNPALAIEAPTADHPVAAGSTVKVRLSATEQAPARIARIEWTALAAGTEVGRGTCLPDGDPTRVVCAFVLRLPTTLSAGDVFRLDARALDGAPTANVAVSDVILSVRPPPTAWAMSPARGGTAGGTDVVIRGAGFVKGTRVLVGGEPLLPDGGIVIDERTINGQVPPHPPGAATVLVQTPIGDAPLPLPFEYRHPPLVTGISSPETLPADPDGGTPVRVRGAGFGPDTRIYFGLTLASSVALQDPMLMSDEVIEGKAPGGRGRTHVWAFDAALGWTRLANSFSWSDP